MVSIAKKTPRYPTDLTDEESAFIESLMPVKPNTDRDFICDLATIALLLDRLAALAGVAIRGATSFRAPWPLSFCAKRRADGGQQN